MDQNFAKKITDWYKVSGRNLPWRQTNDPYKIWLSEVILQQTRVDQGLSYYNIFSNRFPDVRSLAMANPDEVMKLWQGLGYYSRARNLHAAAQQIIHNFNGKFPDNYQSLRLIKGIGDYTAGAIASIAYNEPVSAIDGNVYRVISRLWSIIEPIDKPAGKLIVKNLVDDLIDKNNPGTFNQALMELGALVCKPRLPLCSECPVNQICSAFLENKMYDFPVKSSRQKPRERFFLYLIPTFQTSLGLTSMLKQRDKKDIWQQLFEFPLLELTQISDLQDDKIEGVILKMIENKEYHIVKLSGIIKHQLTHQTIYTRFIHASFQRIPVIDGYGIDNHVHLNNLNEYALPRLIDRYLETAIANNLIY